MFKKFIVCFISLTLAALIGIGSIIYAFDPFNVYRADKDMRKIIYQSPYYQNVGIAKYTEYDTLITGTSMTQNFRAWWFDEKFGCKAIRLSFDGGIISDFKSLLDAAVTNNKQLKTVYFGLDNYLITDDSDLKKNTERIPGYMLDNNPFSNIKYLLNKDVLFDNLATYHSYRKLDTYDFYDMHSWDMLNPVYGREVVLKTNIRLKAEEKKPNDYFIKPCNRLLETLEPIISGNKNTEFILFAPPYSILYWYTQKQAGTLDATLYSLEYVYGKLLQYDNVRMYYFQNDFERITDLDNYKDNNHYSTDYNKFMLECFVNGEHEVDESNYKNALNEMKAFAKSYDYDKLIAQ